MFEAILGGLLGGFARGLLGFLKKLKPPLKTKFDFSYFLLSSSISAFVGGVCALAVENLGIDFFQTQKISLGLAIVIGYAGGDFLEGLYKILLKKIPKKL